MKFSRTPLLFEEVDGLGGKTSFFNGALSAVEKIE
jgi:hypothetical protein